MPVPWALKKRVRAVVVGLLTVPSILSVAPEATPMAASPLIERTPVAVLLPLDPRSWPPKFTPPDAMPVALELIVIGLATETLFRFTAAPTTPGTEMTAVVPRAVALLNCKVPALTVTAPDLTPFDHRHDVERDRCRP